VSKGIAAQFGELTEANGSKSTCSNYQWPRLAQKLRAEPIANTPERQNRIREMRAQLQQTELTIDEKAYRAAAEQYSGYNLQSKFALLCGLDQQQQVELLQRYRGIGYQYATSLTEEQIQQQAVNGVVYYTDGGFAVVKIVKGVVERSYAYGSNDTTGQRMELTAFLSASRTSQKATSTSSPTPTTPTAPSRNTRWWLSREFDQGE